MTRAAVLILSYNDAATIGEAVRSVALQARATELQGVVLADDGSRDDTIVRAEAARGSLPLKVIRAERNQGQWPNLNNALLALDDEVEWVLILHADDIAVAGWVDAMLTRIASCEDDVASICSSWDMLYADRLDRTGEDHADPVRLIKGGEAAVHDTLLSGCWWKISGAALRLAAFREVGAFDSTVPHCGDWDWSLRALAGGWSFEYLPRVYVHYRQHGTTISTASLRDDVEIADAMTVFDRFGHTLNRREVVGFHTRRGYFVMRRMGRGLLRRDLHRVVTSVRTWSMLGRHLIKRLGR